MIYIVVVAGVVLVLSGVTIWKTVSVRNEADFLVAGRKLPWAVLVFTLLSSWIGAGSLFAGGENAYRGFIIPSKYGVELDPGGDQALDRGAGHAPVEIALGQQRWVDLHPAGRKRLAVARFPPK